MDGKFEVRTALGPDYRTALKKLPGAVALLQHDIALAERKAASVQRRPVTIGRYPLAADQMALRNYQARLAFDDEIRSADHRYANMEVDDLLGARLRDGFAGKLSDDQLADLVGDRIERFRHLGNTTAERGTEEWRTLARAICISEYEAMSRVAERNEGDFTGKPAHPILASVVAEPDPLPPVKLTVLLEDYLRERGRDGKGREAGKRWRPVFDDLRKFIKHDDARRLTKQNLLEWKDERLQTLAPKTVADVYLASVRTVLTWAVNNDRLESNVADKVRITVSKKPPTREQGFTDPEALAILEACQAYVPAESDNPKHREFPETTAAKRWGPLLCAFTGARIAEITQLRKQDIRQEGETTVIRITPEAGTVKAGGYRDVPLHQQVIDLGFLDYVESAKDGPIFYRSGKRATTAMPARTVAGRVSQWLQGLEIVPAGVSPNHGWRHRFKTVGRELGISDRVLDAIQGHASKTAGDNYGDVTLTARKMAIGKLPSYEL